jgi:eukaryotic-like serine/threonine-protein kinase
MSLAPGTLIGPYEVASMLGSGGMGEVYRARDARLGREVALKLLPAAFTSDPDRLARFEREARSVAALSHPNILAIHDFGRHDGVVYATFELLEGSTLRERLGSGPLTLRKAASIAAQIARGLDAAHSRGIVHRDLKPENILITTSGLVKILDFGIACVSDALSSADAQTLEMLTAPGVTIGTSSYMAPEQVRGERVTAAADLFGVGVLLHEMISGSRPFDRPSPAATMSALLHEDAPPLPASTPVALTRIVERLLEKAPGDRFRSAFDLAFALEALAVETSAHPAIATRRRRFAWPLAIAAAALVAAASGWALGRSNRSVQEVTFEPLTFRRGTVFQARFGSRGTVLYSAAWDGQPVEVFETSGGRPEARPLGIAPANLFAVSPSGEVALALVPSFPLTYFHPGRLATVPIAGGTPREVAEHTSAADWTADGRELALARVVNAESRIELPFGNVLYSSVADQDPVASMRVSPNGDRIAFWHGHNGSMILSVVDRAGNRKDLLRGRQTGWGVAWTPDGSEVWVARTNSETLVTTLVAVAMDSQMRELLKIPSRIRLHDISSDGTVLLTTVNLTNSLYLQIPDRPPRPLSWFSGTFVNDISPDGQFVLFAEPGGVHHPRGLFFRATDGQLPIRIGEGNFPAQSPRLSPAATHAAVIEEGKVTVWPVGPGGPRHLNTPSAAVSMLAWDKNTHVVYAAADGGLYRQVADGTLPATFVAKIACPGGPVTSSDGRLACSDEAGGINVVRMDGTDRHTFQPSENAGRLIGWTVDNRAVYSYREGGSPTWVARTNLTTGEVTRIADLHPPDATGVWRIHPVRVTPDGRVIAFTVTRELSELYVYSGLR